MRVYVNDRPVELAPGMRVRHALVAAGFPPDGRGLTVRDEWGHVIGLDGALSDGARITVEGKEDAGG
ncbi:MAG: hypothetical protein K6T55_02900 [Syntrophobacterales bacterium]|nr:hypothetical protein [Syntrophobacterales bacterium]